MDLEKRKHNSNELIQIYLNLKDKYRNYDTRSALRFMQAFRRAVVVLRDLGIELGLEILGSLNFGLAEKNSDADLIIFHYCDIHRENGECFPNCSNLNYEKEQLSLAMASQMSLKQFNVEILDCINLKYIDYVIKNGYQNDDLQVMRLLFYFVTGRPVNRSLFTSQYKSLIENINLINNFNNWASEALSHYLRTTDHRYSFQKYNERILSYGLQLPIELRQELEKYLV